MPQLGTRIYSESHTRKKGEGKKYMVIDMGAEGSQWSWNTLLDRAGGKGGDITERWQRRWSTEELMPSNCGAGEDF